MMMITTRIIRTRPHHVMNGDSVFRGNVGVGITVVWVGTTKLVGFSISLVVGIVVISVVTTCVGSIVGMVVSGAV